MKLSGTHNRSIVLATDSWRVELFDQRLLPHALKRVQLSTLEEATDAITQMLVRGAPLIGLTAAYGLCLALRKDASDTALHHAYSTLLATRPTAVNLHWALERMKAALLPLPEEARVETAYALAGQLCDEDAATCEAIGTHGLPLIRAVAEKRQGKPVRILTHCNAGWLATCDWGTATAPLYKAHGEGIALEIWVDETRPRLQGAITAWELGQQGIPCTVIADNSGGLLMWRGEVDMCIVGADRVLANGDVCNKIGTYLKALAAHAHGVPFYVAFPLSTFDPHTQDARHIEIENRSPQEILTTTGIGAGGTTETVRLYAEGTQALNPGFDVTPAKLVSGYITEKGVWNTMQEAGLTA